MGEGPGPRAILVVQGPHSFAGSRRRAFRPTRQIAAETVGDVPVIAWLEGTLRRKDPARCVVACNGVGYGVAVPASTFARLPDEGGHVALFIHTHVREGSIELFGFDSQSELDTFELLLGVSGIGPRSAIAVLSGLTPADLYAAVSQEDPGRLRGVPGVGKKTAEKIVFELRDKLPALPEAPAPAGPAGMARDLVSALVNLGYKRQLAEVAAKKVLAELGEGTVFDELLRGALQRLTK